MPEKQQENLNCINQNNNVSYEILIIVKMDPVVFKLRGPYFYDGGNLLNLLYFIVWTTYLATYDHL
jgi:hypothetical protein